MMVEAKAQVMLCVIFAKHGDAVVFGGYLRIFGSLEILGIATISVVPRSSAHHNPRCGVRCSTPKHWCGGSSLGMD